MKHFAIISSCAILFANTANANLEGAILVADEIKCVSDHLVFETSSGYVAAEWFGGIFYEGFTYFGDFHSFGMSDVFDANGDKTGSVWVDDFWLTNEQASRFCFNG